MDNPFDIVIYDRNFNFTGFVVDPIFINLVPSWDNQGYGNFALAATNPHTEALQADGARLTIHYRGQHILSGPIRSFLGDIEPRGYVTYQVSDDKRILDGVSLYVRPDKPLAPSGLSDLGQAYILDGDVQVTGSNLHQYGYFHWPDGSSFDTDPTVTYAETAIKYVVKKNAVDRLGLPITIRADQKRGGDVTNYLPKVRFVPLSEVHTPIKNASGLGTKLWQDAYGSTINFDVVQPGEWTQVLTLESGIIVSGSYQRRAPDVTRPLLMGPGETASRALRGVQGKTRTADEQAFGDVIEIAQELDGFGDLFWPQVSGKDIPDDQKVPKYYPFKATANNVANFERTFTNGLARKTADGASNVSLSVKLQESEVFHFGGSNGIQLGDYVNIQIQGQTFREQVTEVQMDFTRDNGLVISPIVGDYDSDPDRVLARKVAAIYKSYRRAAAMR